MKSLKAYITYGVAVLLLLGLIEIFSLSFTNLKVPATESRSFSEVLWNSWGITIVIAALIIFASGASILVLLGGKWQWE